ncbi:MAG TPA: hypothetical protein VE781_10280 [Kineosporiaceae bacterium]|jgi:hypothetical protein|nr:hypothetical protein [Kineosporiaceae bacterium]
MNVSGVGATPPAPQPPPVSPVVPPAPAEASDARHGGGSGERGRPVPKQRSAPDADTRPSAPPLRMLTVTEMRVMLGQLPAAAAVHEASPGSEQLRRAYG